jgi:hypothetical protein
MRDYYVCVYIDPRNHEEFYYGKGVGSRKDRISEISRTPKSRSESLTYIKRGRGLLFG